MHMTRQNLAGLTLLAGAAVLAGGARAQGTEFTNVQRGRYLAQASDCISCHTLT